MGIIGHKPVGIYVSCLLLAACGSPAVRGDGGTLRMSQCAGEYRISIFTSPTPVRTGPLDISVFVQTAESGASLPDVNVIVTLTPVDAPASRPMRQVATSDAATNKLLKAAIFELPTPGRWQVDVAVQEEGQGARARVGFESVAAKGPGSWPALWPWFVCPAPLILLFVIHQWLVCRHASRFKHNLLNPTKLNQ